nr:phosphatidylinositol phosphatase PTPRQ-like [Procambarus clarkii]
MKTLVYLAAVLAVCAAAVPGHIENFQQTGSGDGEIVLEWDFVEGDYPLHKYTIVTDSDFSNDVRCTASHCSYTVTYLEACKAHKFDLIPMFDNPADGTIFQGDVATTTGYTADTPPSAATNVVVVSEGDTGTTIQWDAPEVNSACVESYKVCAKELEETLETNCQTVDTTSVTMAFMQGCGNYEVTVTPLTPSGNEGPAATETVTTKEGVPGPPRDVVVGITTDSTIELKWNDPLINPLCVHDYTITYGAITDEVTRNSREMSEDEYDHHATIGPLDACTNYSIEISSISESGINSAPVLKFANTNETAPQTPSLVVLDPSNPESIDVSWDSPKDACAASFVICWYDGIHPVEECEEVPSNTDNFTITGLLPCSNYQVTITSVTPGGIEGVPTADSTTTQDVEPGPVKNLMLTEIHENAVRLSFEPPETNPQCVKEYDIRVIDQDMSRVTVPKLNGDPVVDLITGLEACTNYLFKVRAITKTNKESPWSEVYNRTSDATPSEPQQFGLESATTTSITLHWFQPATNTRCVTEYLLSWQGANNEVGTMTVTDITSFKNEVTVDGLNPCEKYTFNLSAISAIGESHVLTFTQSTICEQNQ